MLSKLIKHEFKSSYRNYLPVYVGIILVSLVMYFGLKGDSIETALYALLIAVILIIVLYVLVFVNVMKSLGERIFGHPGYLLFTVPAQTKDIVLSRVIVNFLWIVVSTLIGAIPLLLFVGYIDQVVTSSVGGEFSNLLGDFALSLIGIESDASMFDKVISVVLRVFDFLQIIAVIFIAYTVSNTIYHGDKKKLIGFIIFFALTYIVSLILGTAFFTTTEITTQYIGGEAFESYISYHTTIQKVYVLIFKLLVCGFAFVGSGYLIEKKLELE
ncbi:MAG: hypothetical protein WCR19_01085 [Acholeplasmataceae bacterium]